MLDADPLLARDLGAVEVVKYALVFVVDDPARLRQRIVERHRQRPGDRLLLRLVEGAAGTAEFLDEEIVDKELFAGIAFHAVSPLGNGCPI